jgi:integrase
MEFIPMSSTPLLIESSFADAIAIIAAAPELREQKRRHWITSLRQIAKAVDRPLEVIPARYTAVRAELERLHQAPAGLTAKTLRNHKSNVKSALLWLAREKGIPRHGAPLTPPWEELRAKLSDGIAWSKLSSFARFCSASSIAPGEVDEIVIEGFLEYRARMGKPAHDPFRRQLARAWNANIGTVAGWPAHRLVEPPLKAAGELPWEAFPEGLQHDVERYLASLTRVRRGHTGKRIRPLKPSTLRQRRVELLAAARMAVKEGVPIDSLTSLSALLAPAVAEKVLDAYWRRNGESPKLFTIYLACRFVAIAKEMKCLDEEACERLEQMRQDLEDHRRSGLTDKNVAFLRLVLTAGAWDRVVKLPRQLMAAARRLQHQPVRAAVTAQLAVAIAILSVAPVRLANLTGIRLGTNLIKPDGPGSDYWLMFPDYDVKNRVRLEYPLHNISSFIDEYVHDHRPVLLRGRNEEWLFPGEVEGAKHPLCLSKQICKRIYKETGVRMTVHQFRHAAGAIILKHRPGEYELVRLLLGHRNVQTTINCYVGLDSIRASEIFGEIVMQHLRKDSDEEEHDEHARL